MTGEMEIAAIKQALEGLRFGSVEITVHDSRIVQVERKERVRLHDKSNQFGSERKGNGTVRGASQ